MKSSLISLRVVSIATGLAALAVGIAPLGGRAGASGSGTPTGSPITVGGFDSLHNPEYSAPETQSGLQAAIADINAHGGINGHLLKLKFCDSNYVANQELACTNQLIAAHVSALLATGIEADSTGREYTAAKTAGMPIIGTQGLTPAELTSPVTFPSSSGIPGWANGAADALVAQGIKKINILTDTNDPPGNYFASLIATGLKSDGIVPNIVTADPTSDPTLSTAASEVTQGAKGIIICMAPVNIPKVITAIKQAGYRGKISSLTALFVPAILKALGSNANGILLSAQEAFTTDTSNSGVKKFLSDMKKYEPNATVDNLSENAWTAAMLYATVAKKDDAYNSAAVLRGFKKLDTPISLGTIAPYKVVGDVQPLSQYTRIFNPTVQIGTVVNGKLVANGKGFVNPFNGLKG